MFLYQFHPLSSKQMIKTFLVLLGNPFRHKILSDTRIILRYNNIMNICMTDQPLFYTSKGTDFFKINFIYFLSIYLCNLLISRLFLRQFLKYNIMFVMYIVRVSWTVLKTKMYFVTPWSRSWSLIINIIIFLIKSSMYVMFYVIAI